MSFIVQSYPQLYKAQVELSRTRHDSECYLEITEQLLLVLEVCLPSTRSIVGSSSSARRVRDPSCGWVLDLVARQQRLRVSSRNQRLRLGSRISFFTCRNPAPCPRARGHGGCLLLQTKLLEWLPRRVLRCAQPQNLYFFMKNGFREAGTTRNMRFPKCRVLRLLSLLRRLAEVLAGLGSNLTWSEGK
jgi:hypothetical protein